MTNPTAARYGLIAGISIVAYFLLFYFINARLLFNPWVYWASVGVYLAVMWKALQDGREASGGQLPFQEGLRAAFLIFVVANLVYYCFYYLLFGLLDPSLVELQKTVMRESLEHSAGLLSEQQRQDLLESLEDDGVAITPGTVFFTYLRSLIGGFIAAAGLAALVNRV